MVLPHSFYTLYESLSGRGLRPQPYTFQVPRTTAHARPCYSPKAVAVLKSRLCTEKIALLYRQLHPTGQNKEPSFAGHNRHGKLRYVGNQQIWDTLRAERSGAVLRCGELPEGHVVLSSPFDCLGFYLPSAL